MKREIANKKETKVNHSLSLEKIPTGIKVVSSLNFIEAMFLLVLGVLLLQ